MAILNEVGSMWIEKDNATGVHLTFCIDSVDKLTQVGREWAIKWNFCVRVCRLCGGRIAQSVEHSANNAAVQGSSPCMTILLPSLIDSIATTSCCFVPAVASSSSETTTYGDCMPVLVQRAAMRSIQTYDLYLAVLATRCQAMNLRVILTLGCGRVRAW